MGKMIVTCIVLGGEAPACFASGVADYLVYGEVKSSSMLPLDMHSLRDQIHKGL